MKKKEIEEFVFVRDGFGPIPVYSLMHFEREANDAFMMRPETVLEKKLSKRPDWMDALILFERHARRRGDFEFGEIVVSGTVWYSTKGKGIHKRRFIEDLKIESMKAI